MYKVTHHLLLPLPLVMLAVIASVIGSGALAASPDYQVEVIDLNPEQSAAFSRYSFIGAYRQGSIYFQAIADEGREVFVADGTPAGTRQLLDLLPGPDGSVPSDFTRVGAAESANSRVFFLPRHQQPGASSGLPMARRKTPCSPWTSSPGRMTERPAV